MDERATKRLLITLAVAIAIIMLAKFLLTNTFTHLNQAAAKKQAAARQPVTPAVVLSQTDIQPEATPASAVFDIAASAVEASAQ